MPPKTPSWVPFFLEELEKTGSNSQAVEATAHAFGKGIPQMGTSVSVMKSRNKWFRTEYNAALSRWGYQAMEIPQKFPSQDFLAFREMCCGYRRQSDRKFVKATNVWFHRDAYQRFTETRRQINVFPPGHNKTTLYAIEMPAWLIMGDRDVRIAVVQKNQVEAKKIIGAVQDRLSSREYYDWLNEGLRLQGETEIVNPLEAWFASRPFQPPARRPGASWGSEQFTVEGRRSGEKDYTMQAFGVGSGIQGGRYDYIIINGNFFSPDDFMHRLIAAHPEFTVANYPALIPDWKSQGLEGPNEEFQGDQVPLWPEYWSLEGLAVKQIDVGPRTWHHTWLQEQSSFADATFNREAIEECKDHELKLGVIPSGLTDIYLGVDPAAAENGFCAMILWGLNRTTKQRYLLDVFNRKGMRNWNNVIDQIAEYCRAFPVRKVIIEGNNTQKAGLTEQTHFKKMVTELGTRWEVYQTVTGAGARAVQSNFDITTIGRMFDEGLITIPYGGTFDEVHRIDEYIDQLCAWRTDEHGHSIKYLVRDMVMATLFAESEAFVAANRPTEKPRQNPSPQPWAGKAWNRHQKVKRPLVRDEDGNRWLDAG